jgi:hypothetical protein
MVTPSHSKCWSLRRCPLGLGLIGEEYLERMYSLYASLQLPMMIAGADPGVIWNGLVKTTLHRGGRLNMPMPCGSPGECEIIESLSQLSPAVFESALTGIRARALPHLVLDA